MNEAVRAHTPSSGAIVGYAVGESALRPWGSWEVVAIGANYTLKRIEVHVGQRLSLQYHEFRTEHWTFVNGHAEVEIEGQLRLACAGDHLFIPLRARHRVRNIGKTPLTLIELQMGDVLDENDIVRIIDDYGRANGGYACQTTAE